MKILIETGSQAGTVHRLYDGVNMLGRDASNRICLPDHKVSRRHCRIRKLGQSLFLYDLGARNGTTVNGKAVVQSELAVGDRIRIGNTLMRVVGEDYLAEGAPAERRRRIGLLGFIVDLLIFRHSTAGARKRTGVAVGVPSDSRQETRLTVTDPD